MPKKPKQLDLIEHIDTVTGEVFYSRAANHYEKNDGVPFAPPVDMPRPTIRQRVENLLNRGADPLAHYIGTDDYDMEVPDDPDAPLTHAEQMFIETVASDLAEAAPLPDDSLPRQPTALPPAPQPVQPGVASPPAGPDAAPAASPASTVPSR